MENFEFIDVEGYSFFCGLPKNEQILCLYDYWISDPADSSGITLSELVDNSIQTNTNANILFTNDLLIINSNYQKHIKTAIRIFFETGMILQKITLDKELRAMVKRQKYCNMYEIVGSHNPMSMN